jgi:S-adenosylmethionine hydrolase
VGTQRKALVVKTNDYYFVAPDNGLLWETLKEQRIIDIKHIPVPRNASNTFHGRDVFAKAAANINKGNFDDIGEKIEEIEKLELYINGREGTVVRIDRFGNIITNLSKQDKDKYSVEIDNKKYRMNFYANYETAQDNELFLIKGSCDTLEISLKNGNAYDRLRVKAGQKITIS